MSNRVLFPSLSETGWIASSEQIADSMFAQFYESDYSQTHLYRNEVASFAFIIQQGQGNVSKTIGLLESTLHKYFGRYFQNVTVEVRDVSAELIGADSDQSAVSLGIYIDFTDTDGVTYNLSRVIQNAGTKSAKVIKLNNGV